MADLDLLLDQHRALLAFVERRVGDRAVAEDLLQQAFVKGLEKGDQIRDDETLLAWFYRVLRNAITDHHRRRAAAGRATERVAAETDEAIEPEFADAICQCISALVPTLKPEQAELLRRVDLEDQPVHAAAVALGLSLGNARVRLHRAREGLREAVRRTCGTCLSHGCTDCTCRG